MDKESKEAKQMVIINEMSAAKNSKKNIKKREDFVRIYAVEVKRQTRKNQIENTELYLGDDTVDFSYQYKFMKLFDYELAQSSLKIIATKESISIHKEEKNQQTAVKAISDAFHHTALTDATVVNPAGKTIQNIKQLLQSIKYKFTDAAELVDLDFYPYFRVLDSADIEELKKWMDTTGDKFVYYNYAKTMLYIRELKENFSNFENVLRSPAEGPNYVTESGLRKDTKPLTEATPRTGPKDPALSSEEEINQKLFAHETEMIEKICKSEYLRKGIYSYEAECVLLYANYRFKRILKSDINNNDKNQRLYAKFYSLFSNSFVHNGIISTMDHRESKFLLLEYFYILLDVFPEFRSFCISRIQEAIVFVNKTEKAIGCFEAELELRSEDDRIKDIVMILILHYDITSNDFVYTLNLIEYLCVSSQKFKYLGLILGDLYDKRFIGCYKNADEGKRIRFYGIAEQSDDTNFQRIAMNSRSRLSVMYSAKFDTVQKALIDKELAGKDHDYTSSALNPTEIITNLSRHRKTAQEPEMKNSYSKMIQLNQKLLDQFHPAALNFFAQHFIRCNDFKIEDQEYKEQDIYKDTSVLISRNLSLNKAAKFLGVLFLLGDGKSLDLYYRLLKLLKYEEAFLVSCRLIGEGLDENLFIPLAYCKEKGISCDIDLKFALKVYEKAIKTYIQNDELYKIGLVLYRVGLIKLMGVTKDDKGDPSKASIDSEREKRLMANKGSPKDEVENKAVVLDQDLIMHSIKCMVATVEDEERIDKRFLYHLSQAVEKVDIPERDIYAKELMKLSYQMYPTTTVEYLIHYEIEKKIERKLNFIKSKEKSDFNKVGLEIQVTKNFSEEELLRSQNVLIQKEAFILVKNIQKKLHMVPEKGDSGVKQLMAKKLLDELEGKYKLESIFGPLEKMEFHIAPKMQGTRMPNEYMKKFEMVRATIDKVANNEQIQKIPEKQMMIMFEELLNKSKHVRRINCDEGGEIDSIDEKIFENGVEHEVADRVFIKKRFRQNGQLCMMLNLHYRQPKDALVILDNFDTLMTYHPLFLNTLGVDISYGKTNHGFTLITEYFDKPCTDKKHKFLSGESLSLSKMLKVIYQAIHILRSLHAVGKVCHYFSPYFMVLTPDSNLKLILPFFNNEYQDLSSFFKGKLNNQFENNDDGEGKKHDKGSEGLKGVKDRKVTDIDEMIREKILSKVTEEKLFFDRLPEELFHFAPELLEELAPKTEDSLQRIINRRSEGFTRFFAILDTKTDENEFKYASAADIWALGVFLFHLYTGQPFYPQSYYHNYDGMLQIGKDLNKLEKHVNQNISKLPRDISPQIKALIQRMLHLNPLKRPSIHEIHAAYEVVVFSYLYHIPAMTVEEINKMMFGSVYYERIKLAKVEDEVEKIVSHLPKGYTYEGEAVEWIPHGKGTIKLKNKVVVEGYFNQGMLYDKAEITFDNKHQLSITKSYMGFPISAKITYNKYLGVASSSNELTFEDKSWLANNSTLTAVIDSFKHLPLNAPKEKDDKIKYYNLAKPSYDNQRIITVQNIKLGEFIKSRIEGKKKTTNQQENNKAVDNSQQETERYKQLQDFDMNTVKEELKKNIEVVQEALKNYDKIEQKELLHQSPKKSVSPISRNSVFQFLQKESIPLDKGATHKKDLSSNSQGREIEDDFEYSAFVDPFGNCIRMKYNNKSYEVLSKDGLYITSIEAYKCFHITVFRALSNSRCIFNSRVNTFGLCESKDAITNFQILNSKIQEPVFDFVIITEVSDIEKKQYRGSMSREGPERGTLYSISGKSSGNAANYIDFTRSASGEFNGFVIDKESGIEYEGGLVNLTKHGYGCLRVRKAADGRSKESGMYFAYIGQFKHGLPHGKGMYLDKDHNLIFKGIFSRGTKKYGTSFHQVKIQNSSNAGWDNFIKDAPDGTVVPLENHGIFKRQTQGELTVPTFIKEMSDPLTPYSLEGSIRMRRTYPIYFGVFRGWSLLFQGIVKIHYGDKCFYFGRFHQGKKQGPGLFIDKHGNRLEGQWDDNIVTGTLIYSLDTDFTCRRGKFIVELPGRVVQSGHGEIRCKDSTYVGQIRDGLMHGYGVLKKANEDVYEGQFVDGEYDGCGRLEQNNVRTIYEGEFRKGLVHGYASMITDSGKQDGYWEDGRLLFVYRSNPNKTLCRYITESILSKARYDELENNYQMDGLCEVTFLKLINPDNPVDKIIDKVYSVLFKTLLTARGKQEQHARIAYCILEEMKFTLLEQFKRSNAAKSSRSHYVVTDSYKDIICRALNTMFVSMGNVPIDDASKRREGLLKLFNNYNSKAQLIDSIVVGSLKYLNVDIMKDCHESRERIESMLKSEMFDKRQSKYAEGIKNKFINEFFPTFLTMHKRLLKDDLLPKRPDKYSGGTGLQLAANLAMNSNINPRTPSSPPFNSSKPTLTQIKLEKQELSSSFIEEDDIENSPLPFDSENVVRKSAVQHNLSLATPVKDPMQRRGTANFLQLASVTKQLPILPDSTSELSTHRLEAAKAEFCPGLALKHHLREAEGHWNTMAHEKTFTETFEQWKEGIDALVVLIEKVNNEIPDKYEGKIFCDEITGEGIMYRLDRFERKIVVYQGDFKDNLASGLGKLLLNEKMIYIGMIEEGEPQGYGTLVCGKEAYEGRFLQGKREGVIIRRNKKHVLGIGEYSNGERQGVSVGKNHQNQPNIGVYDNGAIVLNKLLQTGDLKKMFREVTPAEAKFIADAFNES
jgi:serine/threonine protein kinase